VYSGLTQGPTGFLYEILPAKCLPLVRDQHDDLGPK